MPVGQQRLNTNYGFPNPLADLSLPTLVIARAPQSTDYGVLGQQWLDSSVVPANLYFMSANVAGSYTWTQLSSGGGSGVFSSLTVTPGPISLTGTTNINISGAAVTTIGTGGTGAVHIGNATGNTLVTGTLTSSAGITATTGNITATAGNIISTLGNITANAGNIESLTGDIIGVALIATGDNAPIAGETAFSNIAPVNAGGTGVCVIQTNTGTATPDNVGFIKIYVGTTAFYVPYFDATVL